MGHIRRMLRAVGLLRDGAVALPVTFYTRQGCQLCDEAFELLQNVARAEHLSLRLDVVDIDQDPQLISRYGDKVPVLAIDGRERLWGRINLVLLHRTLKAEAERLSRRKSDRATGGEMMRTFLSLVSLALLSVASTAGETPAPASPEQLRALSNSLRDTLAANLPTPLHEKVYNWNETEKTPSRIRFDGLRPRMIYKQKNDGMWRKVRVEADNPEKNLILDIRNVGSKGDDTTTFDVLVSLKAKAHYHQQNWQQGLKLWDATADAKVRIRLLLHCESTARFEKSGGPLPELVYRLRVVKAEASYHDLEVTHIAGVGGDLARFIGDTARKAVHELKPSLEEKLLAKAEKSIIKAADTKELRIGLEGVKRTTEAQRTQREATQEKK